MSHTQGLKLTKLCAMVISLALFVSASGCKKKVPPPPPPPPANNTVTNPPPPPSGRTAISSFSADPPRVERGQGSTLRWSTSNATDMTIDQNVGPVQSQGSRQVFPSTTTTYTLIANGPNGSDTKTVTVEVASAPPPPPTSNTQPTLSSAEDVSRNAQDAYFDYDHNDLRPDAQQALTGDAELLKRIFARDPNFVVVIEGHSDERGSGEYNLGLGDRRATSAKEFLVQLGVPGDRLKTISYGKEKPQCTDASESCYQKNRRAHLAAGQ